MNDGDCKKMLFIINKIRIKIRLKDKMKIRIKIGMKIRMKIRMKKYINEDVTWSWYKRGSILFVPFIAIAKIIIIVIIIILF